MTILTTMSAISSEQSQTKCAASYQMVKVQKHYRLTGVGARHQVVSKNRQYLKKSFLICGVLHDLDWRKTKQCCVERV